MILNISSALVYTAVFSVFLTPLDFILADKIGAIDIPNDMRRMHTKPIPRIGGISIFVSFIIFCLWFQKQAATDITALLSGAAIIISLGIVDDSVSLSAKSKLIFQFIAATLSVVLTQTPSNGFVPDVFSILWLVALTNAHNFIDGLNGLCAGISINESAAIGIILFTSGESALALVAFAICGACIGFMPYNAGNAKIFMGDTGSNFLGFILGYLSLHAQKHLWGISELVVLSAVFSLPISDMIFAVTRRISKKKSPFSPDRSHIHHILADSSLGHIRASLILRIISFLFAVIGIAVFIISR